MPFKPLANIRSFMGSFQTVQAHIAHYYEWLKCCNYVTYADIINNDNA